MDKYADLDAAILDSIANGNKRFSEIWPTLTARAKPHARRAGEEFRVVDRRLQALRKQRKITYWGGKWSVL